ncbi:response regulator, partial [Gammaproteobacteria bacterium]|nr:response regulator [Gammaproteobacteria bacterium]
MGGFTLAAEGDAGGAAVEYVAQHTLVILLLEMSMPDMSGFEVLRRIQRLHLGTRVVALTKWTSQPMPLHAMRAGIDGYLGKDVEPQEFEKALYKIRFGYGDLSDNPFQLLSVGEVQIMPVVLGCKSSNEAADALNLFAKTVNSYRYRVFEKLEVKSDVQPTLLAVWHNVIELDILETSRGGRVSVLPSLKGPLAARSQSDDALAATLGIRDSDKSARAGFASELSWKRKHALDLGMDPVLSSALPDVVACRDCTRLVNHQAHLKRLHPNYWCAPVPCWGALRSRLMIVGLAPGLAGAGRTGK